MPVAALFGLLSLLGLLQGACTAASCDAASGVLLGWAQALQTLAYAAGPVAGGYIALRGGVREPFYRRDTPTRAEG